MALVHIIRYYTKNTIYDIYDVPFSHKTFNSAGF